VERFPAFSWETPCALCVRGDLQVGGSAKIDGTKDPSCGGRKKGVLTAGVVDIDNLTATSIQGDAIDATANVPGSDYLTNQTDEQFAGITLTAANMKTLRELAKKNGTYFGPGYPDGTPASSPTWSGDVDFNSSHKLKNGIVFIDTVSGKDIPKTLADQNPSDFANVDIQGNPFVSGDFTGWIIVNGSLHISGDMKINGLVYAVNDLTYQGFGTGEIIGLAVSQNIRDTTASSVSTSDSATTGNSRITFNCNALQPPPQIGMGYTLVKGSYREVSGY
jgi:hypothetical protein